MTLCGRFRKMPVTERKWICVHDDSCGPEKRFPAPAPLVFFLFQLLLHAFQPLPEAVFPALHKDRAWHGHDLMKAKVSHEILAGRLGAEKCVRISTGDLDLKKMGNDTAHESLALKIRTDRETPQGISEETAGSQDVFILIDEYAAVVQMRIGSDTGILKKADHLLLKPAFCFINCQNGFRHAGPPLSQFPDGPYEAVLMPGSQ